MLDWRELSAQLRAQRLKLLTQHHQWYEQEKEAVEQLAEEISEWKQVLDDALCKAAWLDSPYTLFGPQPEHTEGAAQGHCLQEGAHLITATRGTMDTVDRPPPPPLAPTRTDFLTSLWDTTHELLLMVCKLLPETDRQALRSTCRAGRDAVRGTVTSLSMRASSTGVSHFPMQDLSITHPRLHTLSLKLDSTRSIYLSDLLVCTPHVFSSLRCLSLKVRQHWSNALSRLLVERMQQLVCACGSLCTLILAADSFSFTLRAPSRCHLENLHKLFQGWQVTFVSMFTTPDAKRYLSAVSSSSAGVRVMPWQLDGASQLKHLRLAVPHEQQNQELLQQLASYPLLQSLSLKNLRMEELPASLNSLGQLRSLEVKLAAGPASLLSFRLLCQLPQLRLLVLKLVRREEEEERVVDPELQLFLPSLEHLQLSSSTHSTRDAVIMLLQSIAAPLLKEMSLKCPMVPAADLNQMVSRHPGMRVLIPGRPEISRYSISATSQQLHELATTQPHLLNEPIRLEDEGEFAVEKVVAAVRAAGGKLCCLCLNHQHRTSAGSLDDSVLEAAAQECPNLKHLELRTSATFTLRGVAAVAARLSQLQELCLRGHKLVVDDDCLESIAVGCPMLKHLELGGARNVSERAVRLLCHDDDPPVTGRRQLRLHGFDPSFSITRDLQLAGWDLGSTIDDYW